MRNLKGALFFPKSEMSKKDLIETVLLIINKILDYTSTLNQITPTIFDKNYLVQNKDNESNISTSQSSNDESGCDSNIEKDDQFTLTDYLYLWVEKLEINSNLLILTLMNIDKLLSKEFILTSDNVKNVLFTCMIITQKYYEDENFTDKDYSKIVRLNPKELIKMEIEFLSMIDFSLYISDDDFLKYKGKIEDIWRSTLSLFSFT